MKSTFLTLLAGLSLTFGASVTSHAADSQVIRIPQGRGQYLEIQTAKPQADTNRSAAVSHPKLNALATTGTCHSSSPRL